MATIIRMPMSGPKAFGSDSGASGVYCGIWFSTSGVVFCCSSMVFYVNWLMCIAYSAMLGS